MSDLTFNAERHEYRKDGVIVPHVTGVIKHLTDYSMVDKEALERARQQGVAIHRMVELEIKGQLDPDDRVSLPEWLVPHYQAWMRFREDVGLETWASERKLYHPAMRYAGTADIFGVMHKVKKFNHPATIDVKRSFMAGPAIGVQLAAYQDAWNAVEKQKVRKRYALRFRPGAAIPYHIVEFDDPDDRAMFMACLTQYRWKEKHHGSN